MSRFYGPDQIGLRFTWGSIRLEFRETRAMSSPLGGGGLVRRRVNLTDLDPRSDEASDHASAGRIQRFECGPGFGRQKGSCHAADPNRQKVLASSTAGDFRCFRGPFYRCPGGIDADARRGEFGTHRAACWCPSGQRYIGAPEGIASASARGGTARSSGTMLSPVAGSAAHIRAQSRRAYPDSRDRSSDGCRESKIAPASRSCRAGQAPRRPRLARDA